MNYRNLPAKLLRHSILMLIVLVVYLPTVIAHAEPVILTAPDIHQQVRGRQMILLDIRTQQEWRETGLAEGAWPVSMHEKDFGQRLQDLLEVYRPEQIALICATGKRSARVVAFLENSGVKGVANVSEGMLGNGRNPGWIARGLPMATFETAVESYGSFSQQFQ